MNVIITGASRGIGLELTREALAKGDQVLAVARKPEDSSGLTELATKYGKNLQTLAVELSHPESAQRIVAGVKDWKQVDVLFNNAGIYLKGDSIADFTQSFHLNAVVPLYVTTALLPKLRASSSPKAAHITSLMGSIEDNSSGGSHAYRASKTALNMFSKCLAVENEWLTSLVVHPGWVKTEMGGAGAPVEIPDSAKGIWEVVRGASPETSGTFLDFKGQFLPW